MSKRIIGYQLSKALNVKELEGISGGDGAITHSWTANATHSMGNNVDGSVDLTVDI